MPDLHRRWAALVVAVVVFAACSDGDESTTSSATTPATGELTSTGPFSSSEVVDTAPIFTRTSTASDDADEADTTDGADESDDADESDTTAEADESDEADDGAVTSTFGLPAPTVSAAEATPPGVGSPDDTVEPAGGAGAVLLNDCPEQGLAPYDLRSVEISATSTGATITIGYAFIEPRHAVAVTVVAGDDRHQVVAELFEDDTFVVRIQDLVASDSQFVDSDQVVTGEGMRIEVPAAVLDASSLTSATAVDLVVDGVMAETCSLE